MKRRGFILLLAGVSAFAGFSAAHGQQAVPMVGFLHSGSPGPNAHLVEAFLAGLAEAGFNDSRNVRVEYRWAEGKYDRLSALARELIEHGATVFFTSGGSISAMEARKVSKTVPLIFVMGSDPVRAGLVTSLSRPGGSATGVTLITSGLEAKRLELLRQLVPSANLIAALINPDNPNAEDIAGFLNEASRSLGVEIRLLHAASDAQLESVLAGLPQLKASGILIGNDSYFVSRRDKIVASMAGQSLPAIYQSREFPAAGGLISYGSNLADMYRKAGVYVGRVLKGEKPSDLPIQQPTKFELSLNLKTAKALGLTVPAPPLATADEVIE